ncbi:hypothetical protein KPL70_002376 [Citrus sinensis]|uniref:Uncharacterized protein n=1 Tax=Citrus sinensis TaxID=2711 RepID=A0ACB8MUD1_CITSI|nr:hypothetical protein KPL70_002376 [Citrus sinensis]KAH9789315.1 hypothetical protein KPL71_002966 [Citrus sinensis]
MRIETERAKNLMCLLRDPEGNSLEAAMYFPLHARPQQLSQTVNELLNNFLWRMELSRAYQPQAAFRIRPPNRCSATIAVHTGRVLSEAFSPDDSCWATVGQEVLVIPPSDYGTLIARHQCSLSSGGLHQEVLVVHTRAGLYVQHGLLEVTF